MVIMALTLFTSGQLILIKQGAPLMGMPFWFLGSFGSHQWWEQLPGNSWSFVSKLPICSWICFSEPKPEQSPLISQKRKYERFSSSLSKWGKLRKNSRDFLKVSWEISFFRDLLQAILNGCSNLNELRLLWRNSDRFEAWDFSQCAGDGEQSRITQRGLEFHLVRGFLKVDVEFLEKSESLEPDWNPFGAFVAQCIPSAWPLNQMEVNWLWRFFTEQPRKFLWGNESSSSLEQLLRRETHSTPQSFWFHKAFPSLWDSRMIEVYFMSSRNCLKRGFWFIKEESRFKPSSPIRFELSLFRVNIIGHLNPKSENTRNSAWFCSDFRGPPVFFEGILVPLLIKSSLGSGNRSSKRDLRAFWTQSMASVILRRNHSKFHLKSPLYSQKEEMEQVGSMQSYLKSNLSSLMSGEIFK